MAADSGVGAGEAWMGSLSKILRPRDGVLLGGVTALRALALHEVSMEAPVGSLDAWAHRFAVAVTDAGRASGSPSVDSDGDLRGGFLLACEGRMWEISTRAATPVGRYYAVGSGGPEARGALHALDGCGALERDPAGAVQAAVEAACSWDKNCRYPIVLEVVC